MTPALEAKITPAGSTPVFQAEEGKPAVLVNARVVVTRVKQGSEPLVFPRTIRLGSIPSARVRVLQPISVELSRADGLVVAAAPELEEFGQGDTSSDALNDLGLSLAELFLSLHQEESRLGPDLAQLLATLRTYLVLVR